MTLGQALELVQQRKEMSRRRKIFLVCGFQPLHLTTFLEAHVASRFPGEVADVQTGVYGDLETGLMTAAESQVEAAAVVIEWSDLDPRLGLRSAGGWALSLRADILENCRQRFARILAGLKAIAGRMPVALVSPTLSVPLLGHTAGWQLSLVEAELQKQLATFVAEAAATGGVAVLNGSTLARISPAPSRLDAALELRAGFPYTTGHASALAEEVVKLLFPPAPMKGLITDLDETLWSGIVGEIGAGNVSWSVAEHTQIHGLYQQMLGHLAEMGVLIAIASKNEVAVVEETLQRADLLVPAKSIFPVVVNWGPKSAGIAEILRAWNIGSESVVFVDDSAMELDEVRTAFPAMLCLQFSTRQPAKVMELLEKLRDLFGKPAVHREDALRQASIRANVAVQATSGGSANGEFIRGLRGRLTYDCRKDPANKRLLELINKTNQFNLNGARMSEGEWMLRLADPASFVAAISYEDKFGPLGIIGVVAGQRGVNYLHVTTWVMSCRAFSRRIEFHTLRRLFDSGVDKISLAFKSTERNAPLQQFLQLIGATADGGESCAISRETFLQADHDLPHSIAAIEEHPSRVGTRDPHAIVSTFER